MWTIPLDDSFRSLANTRWGVKNVGEPWEIFSIVPGIDRQIRRTRATCLPPSRLGAGPALGRARFSAMLNIIADLGRHLIDQTHTGYSRPAEVDNFWHEPV
jgi:hypothetical protein